MRRSSVSRSRIVTASDVGLLLLFLATTSAAQPVATSAEGTQALTIQYANGRSSPRVLLPSGGMWTPQFPRIPGAVTTKDGLELKALDVRHVVDGPQVVVTISLLYGAGHSKRVEVAAVRVAPDAPVRVDALRAHGVEPVTIALITLPPTRNSAPLSGSPSSMLDVRVDPIAPNAPGYTLTVTNRSTTHAVMMIQFQGFRGDTSVLTGRSRSDRSEPLIRPGAVYVRQMPMGGGVRGASGETEPWQPLDRLVITSVLWDDDLVEGDAAPAAQERALNVGRTQYLGTVLTLLRNVETPNQVQSLANLRARIDRAGAPYQQIKDLVLSDLDAFQRTADASNPQAFARWLADTTADYERWLARIPVPR